MDILKYLIENAGVLSLILAPITGFFGWLFGSKSRKIDLQTKAFKMNSEMIDSLKEDSDDRVKFLKGNIKEVIEINKELLEVIEALKSELKTQKLELEKYRNNEKNIISNS